MTDREGQIRAFLGQGAWADAARRQIAGDASNRRYERLTDAAGKSAILMDAPPERGEDVRPFVAIADHLRQHGLSTPRIFQQDAGAGLLIMEDFGDALFARLMAEAPERQVPLYKMAAEVLIALREVPLLDLARCDADWLVGMLSPLFEWYAPRAAGEGDFPDLFRPLAEGVADRQPVLMLRDYHAENLLLLPEREGVAAVGVLDFQDAMIAPPAYDLVSILQDARRDVSPEVEEAVKGYYLERTGDDPVAFRRDYALLGLQRNLRILGIFARLSQRDGKPHYIDMIPRVWGYVMRNLAHPDLQPLEAPLLKALPEPDPDHLNQLRRPCPQTACP